jgi:hypothetical protein
MEKPSGVAERYSSAAAAATVSFELPETKKAAAVCLYVAFHSGSLVGSILNRGVARRSFGLLRFDLLLQIDPSASAPRAGYLLRP